MSSEEKQPSTSAVLDAEPPPDRLYASAQTPQRSVSPAVHMASSSSVSAPGGGVANNPMISILAYCGSSILMTTTNKYVLSGAFNMNCLLLAVQSIVCIVAITTAKAAGFITFRSFNRDEARKWFPISLCLIGMIYTGSKALQFLTIPVYTIFKNLTIILIAYGEVLWFGGSVTPMALLSFGLMVVSSVIAAWADIQHALSSTGGGEDQISTLNAGYMWMLLNCFCSATYVLTMRKRIKLTNFKDFDSTYFTLIFILHKFNRLLRPSIHILSISSTHLSVDRSPSFSALTIFYGLQPCSITTSSPYPSFSLPRSLWSPGLRPTSALTSRQTTAPKSSSP